MLLPQLISHIARTSRITGSLLSRCASAVRCRAVSANYATAASSKNGAVHQRWYALDPELEDMLVPRKMAVSPLESWLTLRYSMPRVEIINVHDKIGYKPETAGKHYDWPSTEELAEILDNETESNNGIVQCKNVLQIRRRKMNRHKYKKLLKRTKFLRRKLDDIRRKRRQRKFEKDLKRIWKRAGFREPPEGWQAPKIYLKQHRGKSE
ncbi:aurora kinase A-interacting protein [Protopterus annectens]|uniref:aurora kinase A-interacting protein n=1 Tax=Protopterus annectens TaxID=7888 RepID=UPI001CF970D0|nr:aurora kinase A-interacting protein [Protopterus annectens]XP_043919119.1 aurora kinase A-interacting protein [Protopterus annectens]